MTANMNFGPEWMRESAFLKHTGDISSTSHEFSTSTNDTFLPFNDKSQQLQQQSSSNNPYKYSKDFLLSLFKPDLPLPADFTRQVYATVDHTNTPLAFEELTEAEKKLLSGPVHSEASTRKPQRHRGNDYYSSSPLQSPASENAPMTPGGRFGNRKGRSGDYFGKDQPFRRTDSGDFLRRRNHTDDLSTSRDHNDGHRDASLEGSGIDSSHGLAESSAGNPMTTTDFKSDILFGGGNNSGTPSAPDMSNGLSSGRAPEEIKWFYRDSAGQVQGPFDAQAMQNWYKAGYFAPTLMIRRDDETIFEPLVVICQKVGNDDKPFLTPRPSLARPGFLSGLNQSMSPLDPTAATPDLQSKPMPFSAGGVGAPTNAMPGLGNLFGNNLPPSLLYQQSPYNAYGANPLLGDNHWSASNMNSAATSQPSWLNANPTDLFASAAANNLLGGSASPFAAQQPTMNPMFGSAMNNSNIFDYQRTMNTMQQQQQQANFIDQFQPQSQQLQQQQQQQQAPVQQQAEPAITQPLQQQEKLAEETPSWLDGASTPVQSQPDYHQSTLQQHIARNTSSWDDVTTNKSNNASPIFKKTDVSLGGWSSIPGTPVNEPASSGWGPVVPTAVPSKISEELQSKAPGAQSPRTSTPSSPIKKPIEKPVKATKTIVESFADIQLKEQRKADAAAAAASAKSKAEMESKPTNTTTTTEKKLASAPAPAPAPVQKPVVSLREIQEEELRLAKERKAKQAGQKSAAAVLSTPSWAAANNTPVASTSSSGWAQPVTQKPLSLREIQEMEAKRAAENKKSPASAAQYLAQQEQAANATPSVLSWGVVVPNSKSTALSSSQSGSSAASANTSSSSAPWSAPSGPKKTLREIQQEEELAMKKKAAKANKSAAASLASTVAASNSGYNGSTSSNSTNTAPFKTVAVPSSAADSEWTTVTSVRAPKSAPPPPAPAAPVVKQPTTIKPVARSTATAALKKPTGPSEEFRRWCNKTLRGSLNAGVNRDDIVNMLLSFPVENSTVEIIEDVIYANSVSLDSKGFAKEFMKRRKADMAGHMEIVTAGMDGFYDDEDEFKVVVTKKNKKKSTA